MVGEKSELSMLPSNWCLSPIDDAIDSISTSGLKIKQKEYLPTGQYPIIDQGQVFIGGYTNDESKLLDGDPPVIVFGDHTKVVKFVNRSFAPGADGVRVLKPKPFFDANLSHYFVGRIVGSLEDKGYARHYQFLAKADIPIPPLNEQKRIVEKIEELFSELDKGVESLKTAREQLKVYRQSVLKDAFEGRLTEGWRKEHEEELELAEQLLAHIKTEREARHAAQLAEWQQTVADWEAEGKPGKKPSKPKQPKQLPPLTSEELADLSALPDGWEWIRFGFVVNNFKRGPFGSAIKKEFFVPSGVKVYEQKNAIYKSHSLGSYFISESKYQEHNLMSAQVTTSLAVLEL